MDDSTALARSLAFSVAGYPLYLARTLQQIGFEPVGPDIHGRLPNLFAYVSRIRDTRGYSALYTGLGYYLPAVIVKKTTYDLMATATNHKKEDSHCDVSELIAVCLRESALRINATIITYPLTTMCIGYISTVFFGAKETVDYTLETLYKGIIPKLIFEVTMVWVSIISRRLTMSYVEDQVGQTVISRVPPFFVSSLLYPLNVTSTVMADNGRSGLNPEFANFTDCFKYLQVNNQLKRGASFFWRRDLQYMASRNSLHLSR